MPPCNRWRVLAVRRLQEGRVEVCSGTEDPAKPNWFDPA